MTHTRKFLIAAIAAAPLAVAAPAAANSVCSTAGMEYKVEKGDMDNVLLNEGTTFCVKAATKNSGVLTADGKTTLSGYVTWTNHGGQHPAVSHYVVYVLGEDPEFPVPADEIVTAPPTKHPVKHHTHKAPTKTEALPHTGDAETLWLALAGVTLIGFGVAFYTAGRKG